MNGDTTLRFESPAKLEDGTTKKNSRAGKERCSVHDLNTAVPPDFKLRVLQFFYKHGLASRPSFMQEIYSRIPRRIYVNMELPEDLIDHESGKPLVTIPGNKIRSTKYTPLSFLPKNLFYQFENIANIYFLVLVILGAFQVFGVESPGLAAVPLIVIVCITAIKDAFEDFRRVVSDAELNNSPIHLLTGLHNNNVIVDDVGPWRRFKKKCTRGTIRSYRWLKKFCITLFASKEKKKEFIETLVQEEANELHRVSTVHSDRTFNSDLPRPSLGSRNPRKSHQLHRNRAPTKPSADCLLNPELQKQKALDPSTSTTSFKNRRWKDVNVGDFVRVRANEGVPADMIIISTSDEDGVCYVETKNLDGETNLKTKSCLKCGGLSHLKHSTDLGNTKFWVECDPPNAHLYSFRGTIHYENYDEDGHLVNSDEKESITYDNILLRGCALRNTKWVIGVVVYTGCETKIDMNSGNTPVKKSKISNELNFSVLINFLVLFVLCFVSGLINGLFYNDQDTSRQYFEFEAYSPTSAGNGVLAFFVTLIIYQSLVPISLYISIEIIKTAQAFFIHSDIKMYYPKLDFPCIPQSWNISDDLGQIAYIFSDKTGTLTQNVMEFRKCTIGGRSYGLAYTEAKQGMDKRRGIDILAESERWKKAIEKDKSEMILNLQSYVKNSQFRESALTFVSNQYVEDTILPNTLISETKDANERFMLALAVCHTVVTEPHAADPELNDFKAESPDEAALVSVARDLGFAFKLRNRNSIELEIYGENRQFEVLHIIAFTSARKRMSCVLRDEEGRIMLITKGADSAIYQRLAQTKTSDEVLKRTALHLEDFAKEGLRTLCIAQRYLDSNEFAAWYRRYKEAAASIDDDREETIESINDEIECELELLGGTAIEDRLQEGVPDSISILGEAGIRLWVLTGDRIETAINIGFSCNLLGNDMKLLVIRQDDGNPDDISHIDNLITEYLLEVSGLLFDDESDINAAIKLAKTDISMPKANTALIVDGDALRLVFDDTSLDTALQKKFVLLGKYCKSVLCCRVSPAQKAQVVKVVKENLRAMTLAIGDGANDVAMIQAVNVGVGIAGEEGRQAVMSADYAIGQFRFLSRLLLVHGHWSYKKLAEMIPCFFYKNVVFTFTCFWYGIFNDFDGSYLYEYTFLMFYNLAFTSLPVIFLGIFDQDVSGAVALIVPQLYRSGILSLDWSQYKFIWYMMDGLYQSVIAFFFPYLLYYVSFQNHEGLPIDHRFWMGVLCCCVAVTGCNIYVLLQQYRWDWLSLLIYALSTLVVFFWVGVWSARVYVGEFYKAAPQLFGTLGFWCCYLVATIICIWPRFTYDFIMRHFKPKDVDVIREQIRDGAFNNFPMDYDPTNMSDVEKQRILQRLNEGDTELLEKVKIAVEPEKESDALESSHDDNKVSRALRSIRRGTISRSRNNTMRSRRDTASDQAKYNQKLISKTLDLSQIRLEMMKTGEYRTGARNSLDRISTTQGLPGLTQAETLLSYHTRQSINFDRA